MAINRISYITDWGQIDLSPMDIMMYGGWIFSTVSGWYDADDSEGSFDRIPGKNGSYSPAKMTIPQAVPQITGVYVGSDPTDATRARNLVNRLRSGGRSIIMEVEDDVMTTRREVFVKRAKPQYNRFSEFEFSIDCVAPDPLRYGDIVTSQTGLPTSGDGMVLPFVFPADFGSGGDPGRVTLYNGGSFDTGILMEVTGGLPSGFTIQVQETGEVIEFNRAILDGESIFLDPFLGSAMSSGGADVSGSLSLASSWPEIPAGQSRTLQFNTPGLPSGSPQLNAKIYPAYI